MNDSELQGTLEKLHQELEQNNKLDGESHQQLQNLRGDICNALDYKEPYTTQHYQLNDNLLNDAFKRYEITHPSLASKMSHALDILGEVGL